MRGAGYRYRFAEQRTIIFIKTCFPSDGEDFLKIGDVDVGGVSDFLYLMQVDSIFLS